MSPVRHMDGSFGNTDEGRWLPPPTVRVCEPAQVQHRREDHPWPFLYSYKGDTVIVNTRPTKTKYQEALVVGEAQF